MMTADAIQQFATLPERVSVEEYNLEHFRTIHLLRDGRRTLTDQGVMPGAQAPDFELPQVGGGMIRLSDLQGTPVLLHFGSYS